MFVPENVSRSSAFASMRDLHRQIRLEVERMGLDEVEGSWDHSGKLVVTP